MSSLDSGSHLGRAADTIKKARWLEPLAMGSKFRIISHASTQSLHLHIYPGKKNSIYEANFLPIPYNRSRKATNWFQKSLIVEIAVHQKVVEVNYVLVRSYGTLTRPGSKSDVYKLLHKSEYYPNPTGDAIHNSSVV